MRALGYVDLINRARAAAALGRSAAEHRHHVGAKPGRILGTEPRHCKPVPTGDADLAAEGCGQFANPLHQRLVARHDQRGADRDAALGDRRCLSFCPMSPSSRTFSANTSRPPREEPPAVGDSPASIRSPIAARPNTTISQSRSEALSARSISILRDTRRPVEQYGLLRQPATHARPRPPSARYRAARPAPGAVDLFRRRRRHREPRALAGRDLDAEPVARQPRPRC